MSTGRILKIGHRGCAGHAPENTLAAIERGIALGADYVEIDIQKSSDGRFVLMHDKWVDRTTSGSGMVSQLTWNELSNLDVYGERIPHLHQVLDVASGRVGLILECITPGIGTDLYRQVADFNFKGPVIYASFLHADLRAIRNCDALAMTMALIEAVPVNMTAFAQDAKVTHAGTALDSTTADFVRGLHLAHFQVFVYTADTLDQINQAKALNVEGIISNFPERI